MRAISVLGSSVTQLVLAILLAAALIRKGCKDKAALLALAWSGAVFLTWILKVAFARPRPQPFHSPVIDSFSFPSGHALNSLYFYVLLVAILSPHIRTRIMRVVSWILAAALIASVGWSRIYLGVHYPSDVVAGYAIAALWVLILFALSCRFRDRNQKRRQQHVDYSPGA